MNQGISTSERRIISSEGIIALNTKYRALRPIERIAELYNDFDVSEIMLTSSFAATSALFLKLFSEVNKVQTIYFIDTGYHFPETHHYKKELSRLYDLNVKSITALTEDHDYTSKNKTWIEDPDQCCFINKVKPLDIIKNKYTVWASGLMKWQSDHRESLDIFEMRGDILKFYPLLDVTRESRDAYIEKENLPFHPLVSKGYHSIGCTHCTIPSEGRTGRWNNNPKTECGLHL